MPNIPRVFDWLWTPGPLELPLGPGRNPAAKFRVGDNCEIRFSAFSGAAAVDPNTMTLVLVVSETDTGVIYGTIADAEFVKTSTGWSIFLLNAFTRGMTPGISYSAIVTDLTSGTGGAVSYGFLPVGGNPEYSPVTPPTGIVGIQFGGAGADLSTGVGLWYQATAGAAVTPLGIGTGLAVVGSDLTSTGGGGGGSVNSVTAGNSTITIGGTASNPTVRVTAGTFDAAGAAAAAQAASQPVNANLTTLAGITLNANTFPARSSSGAAAAKPITDAGLALVAGANAAAMRTTLGLGIYAPLADTIQHFNGTAYYVATTGSDSNAGTDPSAPFLTLSHVAAIATTAGTLVSVGAGTFALGSGTVTWSAGVSVIGAGIDVTLITSTAANTIIYRPGSNSLHEDLTIQGTAPSNNFQFPFGFDDGTGFTNVLARRLKLVADTDGIFLRGTSLPDNAGVSLTTVDCIVSTKYDAFNCLQLGGGGAPTKGIRTVHYNLTITVVGPSSTGPDTARGFAANCGTHMIYGGTISVSGNVPNETSGISAYGDSADINVFGATISASSSGLSVVKDLVCSAGILNVFGAAVYTTSSGITVFDGTLGSTTVGNALVKLANPSAVTWIRINSNNTVTARSAAQTKADLSLGNVENTALSTWAGGTSIVTVGTVTAGTWQGTAIDTTRGGLGADNSASNGVPLFATGVVTMTGTSGTGNFVRVTNATLVTPTLGAAIGTSLSLSGALTALTHNGLTITTTNGTLTIPSSGAIILSGAHSLTLTITADTNVTLPTSGTLVGAGTSQTFSALNISGLTASLPVVTDASKNLVSIAHPTQDARLTGTAYSLTATSAAIVGGTTSPTLTIIDAGTYEIKFCMVLSFNGATFAADKNVTLKLRRTNNTAADLTSGTMPALHTGVCTTYVSGWGSFSWTAADYAATAGDVITVFADVATVPSAGSLDVVGGFIRATRIY